MNNPNDDEQPGPINTLIELKYGSQLTLSTPISPENYVVRVRVISTLEEIEKNMASLNINVTGVCSAFCAVS